MILSMKRAAFLAFVLILAAAALAACSSGPAKISVTATDMKFDPTEWTIPAGKEVEVTLINKGSLEHSWALLKADQEVSPPFDANDEPKVLWKIVAQPGQTETGTFTSPFEPGTYTVVCAIPGHYEAGMVGKVIVK